MTPGEHLQTLRDRLKLTQVKFGEPFGVSGAMVSYWERGAYRPSRQRRRALRVTYPELDEACEAWASEPRVCATKGMALPRRTQSRTVFGTVLGDARRESGLSQLALAMRAQARTSTLAKWERGLRRPDTENDATLDTLVRLADVLDVSAAALVMAAESD